MIIDVFLALLVAFVLALIFSVGLRRPGPWGSFLWFFVVVFLGAMALGAWLEPVGPVAWGVAWIPLIFGALLIALLLAAATPPTYVRRVPAEAPETEAEVAAAGIFLWIFVVGLFLAAAAAYMI